MKKIDKILIYYSIFNLGGAERSTSKLITKLLDEGYDVELLLITNGGKFQNQIDSRAKVSWLRSGDFGSSYKQEKGLQKLLYLILYLLTRIESFIKSFKYKFKSYKSVIIGLHGLSPNYCLKNIKADFYIQFIRNDLKNCDQDNKARDLIKKYGHKVDFYVCVSQTALDSFGFFFPELKQKGKKIYNFLEADIIQEKSIQFINEKAWSSEYFNILTVCRLQDKSKGIYRMANVLIELLKKGHKVRWYIIGDGIDYNSFKNYIFDNNLAEHMILLGSKSNPYPYFKMANLIAVLSYFEGLCGVVNEAKILECPIIATEFSGIREQITNDVNGLVVQNNFESIIKGIEYLIENPEYLSNIAVNEMPEAITNDEYKTKKLTSLF